MLRSIALLFLALPALAAPVLERVTPATGFRYGYTDVTIHGSGFAQPAFVFFGTRAAAVLSVTPTQIRARIAPLSTLPDGTVTDVRVVIEGQGEATLARAFTFTEVAGGVENYEQYLVPITGETLPGAHGSLWKGELTLFNGSTYRAAILGPFDAATRLAPPEPVHVSVDAGATIKPALLPSGSTAGAFIYVPRPADPRVRTSLRIRDLSHNAGNWGTEIPIVASDEFTSSVTLLDIPTDARFRATLRLYQRGPFGGLTSRVRVYVPERAEPVAQFPLRSHAPFPPDPNDPFLFYPAYAQLDLLTDAVRAAGPVIRVEVDTGVGVATTPPPPLIWAFVSVTNNETQQVTVMTP
ncbi:MAG TPA: IPT/TIG domain-containing protein [Thermoanaerobaculia bacterium]